MNKLNDEKLLAMLDLDPAPITIIKSSINYVLIFGAIFLIVILCYYFSRKRKQNQIIKILRLVEKKPDFHNLLLGRHKFKDWLCNFDKNFAFMTELEIAQFLRSKSQHALADFFESTNNIKYQFKFDETNFSNILVSNTIAEIKNIKDAKSVFKIKL